MSARPSRRHASKTDQAKQRLEQLKRLKEDGKKRLDDIDGDEDVANVYDEVRSPFPSSSSSSSSFFPQSSMLLSNVNRKIQKMCALCHRLFSFVFVVVVVVVSRLLL